MDFLIAIGLAVPIGVLGYLAVRFREPLLRWYDKGGFGLAAALAFVALFDFFALRSGILWFVCSSLPRRAGYVVFWLFLSLPVILICVSTVRAFQKCSLKRNLVTLTLAWLTLVLLFLTSLKGMAGA